MDVLVIAQGKLYFSTSDHLYPKVSVPLFLCNVTRKIAQTTFPQEKTIVQSCS